MDMSEKRMNNTIFLVFLASCAYTAAHGLANKQFIEFDREHGILMMFQWGIGARILARASTWP